MFAGWLEGFDWNLAGRIGYVHSLAEGVLGWKLRMFKARPDVVSRGGGRKYLFDYFHARMCRNRHHSLNGSLKPEVVI